MARSGDMAILDDLSGLLAKKVYHMASTRPLSECTTVSIDSRNLFVCSRVDPVSELVFVDLKEEADNASLKLVRVSGIDKNSLILKPDNFGVHYYKKKTYNKVCDYLLLTKFNGERYAIFIDLKTVLAEDQNLEGARFKHDKDYDAEIVWQMIGADAILDSLIDVVAKKRSQRHMSTKQNKNSASTCELSKFHRRYIILYKCIDTTGELSCDSTSLQQPNVNILEKPVHVMEVANSSTIELGAMFSVGGLET